jgi:hypothetical protein
MSKSIYGDVKDWGRMSKSLLVMEIPKSCRGCNFASMEDWGNEYCDVQDGNVIIDKYNETRHPQCPLKQLPSKDEVLNILSVIDGHRVANDKFEEHNYEQGFIALENIINTIYGDNND